MVIHIKSLFLENCNDRHYIYLLDGHIQKLKANANAKGKQRKREHDIGKNRIPPTVSSNFLSYFLLIVESSGLLSRPGEVAVRLDSNE